MNMIARFIREGAMAFLMREYRVLAVYSVAVFAFLFFAFNGQGEGMGLSPEAASSSVPSCRFSRASSA